jgi:hypothetical protein
MQLHCPLLDILHLTPSGLLPSALLVELVSTTSISRRLRMEALFGRVTLTVVILLVEPVVVVLRRMIVGDRRLRLLWCKKFLLIVRGKSQRSVVVRASHL